ncbi:MAG TPA: crossover junction endodeoxyribonuclease RuvC [Alphaproteobacteria bacterium]
MKHLGLDPGLRHTGWGVVESDGNRLRHIANGSVSPDPSLPMAVRLALLHDAIAEIIAVHEPDCAAVEETFVSRNAGSALKLGQARGVVLLAPARAGLPVAEYSANAIKKAVVGVGHADKRQIDMMVRTLLPGCAPASPDAADALAVAICHAHHAATARRLSVAVAAGAAP